jgi:hypothetical protein
MGGELGIKAGEHWAFRESTRLPLARATIINPGRNYYDEIWVRMADDPAHRELATRRAKLPCKWDDLDDYLDSHPETPRSGQVAAVEPVHIVHTTNELRAIIHEEITNALGIQKIAYTYQEAAIAVGLSAETLRVAVHRGDLIPRYAGSKPLFDTEELKRWIISLPDEAWRMNRGG